MNSLQSKIPKKNTVAVAIVEYLDGTGRSKRRPVYILSTNGLMYRFYRITTKYKDKSHSIKKVLFEIMDWNDANLNEPSWIDTSVALNAPVHQIHMREIGQLSDVDAQRFHDFLAQQLDQRS